NGFVWTGGGLWKDEIDLKRDFGGSGGEGAHEATKLEEALADGRPIYIPPGTWNFEGAEGPAEKTAKVRGAGDVTKVVSKGKPILTVNGKYGTTDSGYLRDFKLENEGDLENGKALIDLKRIRNMVIEGVNGGHVLGTGEYLGILFNLDSSYQLTVRNCALRPNRYGTAFVQSDTTEPSEQDDTNRFENIQVNGSAGLISRLTEGNWNSIVLDQFKCVALHPESEAGYDEGTLTAEAKAGESTLTVGTIVHGSLVAGYPILIGSGKVLEVARIKEVSGATITLAQPLLYAHASGEMVVAHGFACSFSENTYAVDIRACHWENLSIGAITRGVRSISIDNYYSSCSELVRFTESERTTRIGIGAASGKAAASRSVIACVWKGAVTAGKPPAEIIIDQIQPISGGIEPSPVDAQGESVSSINYQVLHRNHDPGSGDSLNYGEVNSASGGSGIPINQVQLGGADVNVLWRDGHQEIQRFGPNHKELTESYKPSATDPGLFLCKMSGTLRTITLPAASAWTNMFMTIKDILGETTTKPITVTPEGTQHIDGKNESVKIEAAGKPVLRLYCDGTGWWTV
ncbi:hypothetical protein, partial [Bradyrhizobium sp.]|uniref:hypothetical protein n=1 Tax=Bradyrhizobium sp. TaxID=376 RepID=UPI003C3AD0AD